MHTSWNPTQLVNMSGSLSYVISYIVTAFVDDTVYVFVPVWYLLC